MTELAYIRKRRLRGKNRHIKVEQVYEIDNLRKADHEARKKKQAHKGVRIFDRKAEENLQQLSLDIKEYRYHTSPGHECYRHCPCGKTRLLHKLPYFPDHITHHALMQTLMPSLVKSLYYDSSASVKGKGMIFAKRRIRRYIDENKDAGRLYYGKLDFIQFYHRIVQSIIEGRLARKYSNRGIRYLIHEVVTACEEGLGIGLFPIQPFANFYTSALCREVMGLYRVRVFIYCDDISIIGRDKREVWKAINHVRRYADEVMQQPLHDNIGVQVIDEEHCLDMIGFRFYINRTLIRKRMLRKFARKMHTLKDPLHRYQVATSYKGWLMNCDGFNLWCKITGMKSFKEMKIPTFEKRDADGKRMLDGCRVSASMLTGRELVFRDVEFDVRGKYKKKNAVVQVEENGKKFKFFTSNQKLIETLQYINTHDGFPFTASLVRINDSGLPDYALQ